MHTELVDKRRWIDNDRFLHALNYCMLLPGPEAQQLATYCGWLLHRTWGGLAAGALFVLPSAFLLWLLSFVYASYGNVSWIASIFEGLKPAVTAIVAAAVIRIGQKALKNEIMWMLAALAFIAIYFFKVPFPVIVISAGLVGLVGGKLWRDKFLVIHAGDSQSTPDERDSTCTHHDSSAQTRPSRSRFLKITALGLVLWWTPVGLVSWWQGTDHTLAQEGVFFSKAAMVTFGGAYAVLPYVAQQAVDTHGWLEPGQMLDGLGLAETTPGPLIMVVQFVGFMGGWQNPGGLSPLVAATLGAAITTWVTFVPCFLWIFLGAPHIERLRGNERLTTALTAVTAAVVGVILNLAVWFGLHVLFPAGQPVNWFGLAVAAIAFLGMVKWKWDILPVVLGSGILGWIIGLL